MYFWVVERLAVSQQFLDSPQISAVAEQVRGEGVPQGVRVEAGISHQSQGVALDDPLDASSRQTPSSRVE